MTPIDYTALAERLAEHAALHDSLSAHSDEQAQWAADLRTVASLLRGMADAKPVAWLPAPQPQPIDPHMIAAEDRYPDEPTEAQQGGWTYSHPHWSKCGFDDLVNCIVANAGAFYRDTRDAFRSDVIDALHRAQEIAMQGREPTEAQIEQHPDEAAVDRFAAAMKAKLAEKRAEGRGGWDDPEQCSTTYLATLLRRHVEKGDPLDVGNFAMMLWNRGGATNEIEPTEAQIEAAAKWLDHHLPPEIPACSNRTALAVGVLRAALAAKE